MIETTSALCEAPPPAEPLRQFDTPRPIRDADRKERYVGRLHGHGVGLRSHLETGGWDDPASLIAIRGEVEQGCALRGVLPHAGGSDATRDEATPRRRADEERASVVLANATLRGAGLPCPVVSIGSTPTAPGTTDPAGLSEVRASIFVFFDLAMAGIDVNRIENVALSVLATVIGFQREKGWTMIEAG